MKAKLGEWENCGYYFNLDWLLRSITTVLTGTARFSNLDDKPLDIPAGLKRATNQIDTCLNWIGSRLGLDHDRVLFGRFAIPVMVFYLDRRNAALDITEQDKLLFWFAQAGMWGRFSGSTETMIDQDLAALKGPAGDLDALLDQL